MGTDIKSNFDDIKRQAERNKRRSRLDLLWSMPAYLAGKLLAFIVRYPYVFLVAAIAVAATVLVRNAKSTAGIHLSHTEHIGKTLNHVTQIKAIGQWEALDISCEEMVDTAEKHLLGDKSLVKIYSGNIRLGIDLKEAGKGWFASVEDTAYLCLPKVRLLNADFIDEARTRTFYEKGTWSESASQALYDKARKAMLRRNITGAQMQLAAENIRRQFESMFLSFGYRQVVFLPKPYERKKQ